jgi:hypothetical protein
LTYPKVSTLEGSTTVRDALRKKEEEERNCSSTAGYSSTSDSKTLGRKKGDVCKFMMEQAKIR